MSGSEQSPDRRRFTDVSEKDLLVNLRQGDLGAYEELWCRHHRSALTLAHQLLPGHAEDLVAESFTSVLHTITVSGKGPVDGFRAYLFATMRNSAMRWSKEHRMVVAVADPEELPVVGVEDPPSPLETAEDSAALIRAFRDLPNRWQKVLWMAEVEEAPRPEIATDLGIKPNAVSALLRRARKGLQLRWLEELLPSTLRKNKHHSAHMLPKFIAGQLSEKATAEVASHVAGCSQCAEAQRDLKDMWWRMGNQTLKTLGFGALGVSLIEGSKALVLTTTVAQAATLPPAGGAALGAATSAAGTGSMAAAGSISIFGASVPIKAAAIAASLLLAAEVAVLGTVAYLNSGEGGNAADVGETTDAALGLELTETPALQHLSPADPPGVQLAPTVPPLDQPELPGSTTSTLREPGRLSGDDWVPYLDVNTGGVPFVRPVAPTPVDPDAVIPPKPGPSKQPTDPESPLPPDTEAPETELPTPTVAALPNPTEYIAPILEGQANPGATVNIAILPSDGRRSTGATYTTSPDASGAWSFDLAALELDEQSYELQIWQTDGGIASEAVTSSFSLHTPGVTLLYSFSTGAVDAELDGVPVDFNGPASGTICLVTDTDQRFDINLSSAGVARRFIRFVGAGDYELRFMNCEGTRYGPTFTSTIEVQGDDGPGFGIFGVEGERRVLVDTQ